MNVVQWYDIIYLTSKACPAALCGTVTLKEELVMNVRKTIASAVAAVCVAGAGILPSAPAAMAENTQWLDVGLKPQSFYVKAGEYLDIDVVVHDLGAGYKIGGMQVKVKTYSTEAPELVAISSYHEMVGNVDTAESAFTIKPDVEGNAVVTYQYKIPDDAKVGTNYSFDIQDGFTFACDENGDEIPLEYEPAYTLVTVVDKDAEIQEDVALYQTKTRYVLEPGETFDVDVVINGKDVSTVAGFQFKLNVPEGIECLGLAKNTTDKGTELVFNPDTLEVATAQQKGELAGFTANEKVVTVKFKVPDNFKEDEYTIGITDVYTSDGNGKLTASAANNASWLVVAKDIPAEGGKLGDANLDGTVDAKDASKVLGEYALLSTGVAGTFTAQQTKNGDVNFDEKIDAKDASRILAYYSYLGTRRIERLLLLSACLVLLCAFVSCAVAPTPAVEAPTESPTEMPAATEPPTETPAPTDTPEPTETPTPSPTPAPSLQEWLAQLGGQCPYYGSAYPVRMLGEDGEFFYWEETTQLFIKQGGKWIECGALSAEGLQLVRRVFDGAELPPLLAHVGEPLSELLTDPETGGTFSGWYDSEAGTQWDPSEPTPDRPLTLCGYTLSELPHTAPLLTREQIDRTAFRNTGTNGILMIFIGFTDG